MKGNRLLCTFVDKDDKDSIIQNIFNTYTVLFNKIYLLSLDNKEEYICTYNIDTFNSNSIPLNSIMVHRKKGYNTLYTINALNVLVRKLNNNVADSNYPISWHHYKNSLLLTNADNELKIHSTKISKIYEFGLN
jgi:hypothetical protein